MTNEQIIKAVAELDGYNINGPSDDPRTPEDWCWDGKGNNCWLSALEYLTSYDAIIPVVQKQVIDFQMPMWIDDRLPVGVYFHNATPKQLCEALLRATGKWIE